MVDKKELHSIRLKVNDLLSDLRSYNKSLEEDKIKQKDLEKFEIDSLEARAIIQSVAKSTQQLLEKQFNSLVTLAIQSVFQDDREFVIEFVEKRNKTEIELYIVKEGNKIDLYDGGGGLVDVCSIGCAIAFWNLERNSRRVFILDEKFKFLHSPTFHKNISDVLKLISRKLGIQFILITDQAGMKGDKEFGVINGEVYNVVETESTCPECEKFNLLSYVKGQEEILRCKNCDYINVE